MAQGVAVAVEATTNQLERELPLLFLDGLDMQAGQVPGAQRQRDLSYALISGVPRLEPAKKTDHETVAGRQRRRRHKTAVALAGKHHRAIRDDRDLTTVVSGRLRATRP